MKPVNPFDPKEYENLGELSPAEWYSEFRWRHGFYECGLKPQQAGEICDRMVFLLNSFLFQNDSPVRAFRKHTSDHDCFIEYAVVHDEPVVVAKAVEKMKGVVA